MPEDRAPVLDNWIPRLGYIEVRRGSQIHAVGMGSGPVESLLTYHGLTSASSKLFAITGGSIYDVTAAGAGVVTTVTGLASNRFQAINFTTPAGKFLWICNGLDAPRHFNGSAWATPALTVTTFAASDIINVNAHKNRIWMVFRDSTVAGYLPTASIAGTVTNFELGGLFTEGGHLVAMATITKDGGSGEDDFAAFISSRGQIAIFQGTDPSSADTWAHVGTYSVGPPIGYRCFFKLGGGLALINLDGVVPIPEALQVERSAVAGVAITKNINNAVNDAARNYSSNFGWEIISYPKGTLALLNVPIQEGNTQHQYVMNTLSGAWCRFTGWNANCFAVFRNNLYFGSNDGLVNLADTSSADFDQPIDAIGQTAYNYFKSRGVLKDFKLIQPLLTTDSDVAPAIGLSTDFKDNAVLAVPASAHIGVALFDSAVFDVDVFPVESRNTADWAAAPGQGHCASVHFRARTGGETNLSLWGVAKWGQSVWSGQIPSDVVIRLNGFNLIHERGGFI